MKTKTLILAILAVLFYKVATAQTTASSKVGVYTDIVPDILLQSIYSEAGHIRTYSIDINQDGVNDIEIKTYAVYMEPPADPVPNSYVSVSSLDSNVVAFCLLKVDSACNTNVLKPFVAGDLIGKGSYVTSGYLAKWRVWSGCEKIDTWISLDRYIGVRYSTSNDTAYGWIQVGVGDYHSTWVRDFALEKFIAVGIDELKDESLKLRVYPNPANSILNIESPLSPKGGTIKIVDVLGKEMLNEKLNSENGAAQINVSNLQSGIYFIKIRNTVSKFVIDR